KFVTSPSASGLHVGLGYFPMDREDCNPASYSVPAVPVGALPAVAAQITGSVGMTMPGGGTPTLPALEGVYRYARQREAMVNRRLAVALATDGQPNACMSSVAAVSAAASTAAGMGILTFVIGVGPSLQNLNAIAMAGGTKMAYLVENATADEPAAAFKTVQLQAARLACS